MVDVEDFLEEIEVIARRAAGDYPEVEWQDVSQHLCEFLLTRGVNTVVVGNGGSVKALLRKEAASFCKKERAAGLYYTSQYTYRPSDVKKMLEAGKVKVPEDAVSMKADMDGVDIQVDIDESLLRISQAHRLALYRRYVLGIIPDHSSYDRKVLNGAVNDLTRAMNTYRGGRRHAISNAAAAALISNGY